MEYTALNIFICLVSSIIECSKVHKPTIGCAVLLYACKTQEEEQGLVGGGTEGIKTWTYNRR